MGGKFLTFLSDLDSFFFFFFASCRVVEFSGVFLFLYLLSTFFYSFSCILYVDAPPSFTIFLDVSVFPKKSVALSIIMFVKALV